jgi:hypothetical protein
MKHYLIINEWATEDDNGFSVIGVAHSLEEAKELFDKKLEEEKAYAKENGFEIYEDKETIFDAGEDGYYTNNHTVLRIDEVVEKEPSEKELIIDIKSKLEDLLRNAPAENELDDNEVIDFYAEAKNLWEAIENLGY